MAASVVSAADVLLGGDIDGTEQEEGEMCVAMTAVVGGLGTCPLGLVCLMTVAAAP